MMTRINLFIITAFLLFSCNDSVNKTYYENGNLKSKSNVKDGFLHGEEELYYPSGSLQARTVYSQGKRNGTSEYYEQDGIMLRKETWRDGKLDGITEQFYNDGELYVRENFRSNIRVGVRSIYNKDGSVWLHETYDSLGNAIYLFKPSRHADSVYSRVIPIVKIKQDTISIDEYCDIYVSFGYKLSGSLKIRFNGLNYFQPPQIENKSDTVNHRYYFRLKFADPGRHGLVITPIHKAKSGDTLSADGASKEINIFVANSKRTGT